MKYVFGFIVGFSAALRVYKDPINLPSPDKWIVDGILVFAGLVFLVLGASSIHKRTWRRRS